ncbi:hypothetical protein HA402_005323 [Bradysia odoriphaga]|nr:hypothetical protein HA402_005323 [Bradysia odoriphaga]
MNLRKFFLNRTFGTGKIDLVAAATFLSKVIEETDITVATQGRILDVIKAWDNVSVEDVSSSVKDSGKGSPDDNNELVTIGKKMLASRVATSILSLAGCNAGQQRERVRSLFYTAGCTRKDVNKFKV